MTTNDLKVGDCFIFDIKTYASEIYKVTRVTDRASLADTLNYYIINYYFEKGARIHMASFYELFKYYVQYDKNTNSTLRWII